MRNLFRIWGGPQNARGTYKFPSHYDDGTVVYDNDFTTTWYPETVSWYRWIYGELDYFKMTPPSLACTAIILPQNTNVWKYTGSWTPGTRLRPAVCSGMTLSV